MKKWPKVVLVVAGSLVVLYVVFAAVMMWYFPKRIALEESRLTAINSAIAESTSDQLLLSKRINEIVNRAKMENKQKIDIVYAMLSDADVNRLALNYIGRDFATYKSSFVGEIKHARELLKKQRDIYIKENEKYDDLKRKLRVLESRKKFLYEEPSSHGLTYWGAQGHGESWYRKMNDIDLQIHKLREIDLARDVKNLNSKDVYVNAQALLEKHLFGIAQDYEQKTIVILERLIAERKVAFKNEEQRILLLRGRYNAFNIWPLPAMRRFFFKED